MKNFLVCILIIATFPAFGQRVADSIFKLKLTEKEKQIYVLSIDQSKITKSRDTIVFWGKKNYSYVIVPVKLSNLSNNTLIYINMTCSTYDIFTVNNKNILIGGWACDANFPTKYKIAPHKYSVYNLKLFFAEDRSIQKFRLGMYLIRPKTKHWFSDFMDIFLESHKYLWESRAFKNCLIWSNEVTTLK